MKKIIGAVTPTRSLASLLGLAMTIAISGTARADGDSQSVCGPQTLRGSYVLNLQGFTIVDGVAQPIAVFEGMDFNGDGTFSNPFATVSINGLILRFPPAREPTPLMEAVKAPSPLPKPRYTMTSPSDPTARRFG